MSQYIVGSLGSITYSIKNGNPELIAYFHITRGNLASDISNLVHVEMSVFRGSNFSLFEKYDLYNVNISQNVTTVVFSKILLEALPSIRINFKVFPNSNPQEDFISDNNVRLDLSLINSAFPLTPVLQISPIDRTHFILSWISNETLFNLEQSKDDNPFISQFSGDDFSDDDKTIQWTLPDAIANYKFRIRAKNIIGYSSYSNIVNVIISGSTPTPTPTPTPTTLTTPILTIKPDPITFDSKDYILEWNDAGTNEYNILEKQPLDLDFISISIGTRTFTKVNGIYFIPISVSNQEGIHEFKVKARKDGLFSEFSNIVTVTVRVPSPIDPTNQFQKIVSIQVMNGEIRAVLNPVHYEKWVNDNNNRVLCKYPEFIGFNIPCSLTYITHDSLVSELDNWDKVISDLKAIYQNLPIPSEQKQGITLGQIAGGLFFGLLIAGGMEGK